VGAGAIRGKKETGAREKTESRITVDGKAGASAGGVNASDAIYDDFELAESKGEIEGGLNSGGIVGAAASIDI
jgi:hypothetical protein